MRATKRVITVEHQPKQQKMEVPAYCFEHLAYHRRLDRFGNFADGWQVTHIASGLAVSNYQPWKLWQARAIAIHCETHCESWPEQAEDGRWTVNLKPLHTAVCDVVNRLIEEDKQRVASR